MGQPQTVDMQKYSLLNVLDMMLIIQNPLVCSSIKVEKKLGKKMQIVFKVKQINYESSPIFFSLKPFFFQWEWVINLHLCPKSAHQQGHL
jgi:hypothetical protein